jgi:hypothetical protein
LRKRRLDISPPGAGYAGEYYHDRKSGGTRAAIARRASKQKFDQTPTFDGFALAGHLSGYAIFEPHIVPRKNQITAEEFV